MKRFLLLLVCVVFPVWAFSTEFPEYPDDKQDSVKVLNYLNSREQVYCQVSYNHLKTRANTHAEWLMQYRQGRFRWHAFSSGAIFFVVTGIVITGLVMSAMQFRSSRKAIKNVQVPMSSEPAAGEVQKLSISLSGIEVSSSVLGVVILFISIAFFYLYLTIVYPLNEAISKEQADSAQVEQVQQGKAAEAGQ